MGKNVAFTYSPIVKHPELDTQLATQGYVIVPILSEQALQRLTKYYLNFQKEELNHFYSSTHSPDFEFRKKSSDFIKETISALLPAILTDYRLLGGAFVVKPANGKGLLQAHQDWNLVDEGHARSYNLWIPLMDVNEHNGAVFVLPKSHRRIPTLRGPHIPSPFKNIEQSLWAYLTALPMKAGEALLYDHALIHGSPPNNTEKDRLGVVIGIVKKDVPLKIFGKEDGSINSYACDEDFFLSKNTLTDFTALPVLSKALEAQKELTFREFQETFLDLALTTHHTNPLQPADTMDNRTFFEKYTLKNILAEIRYRLVSKKQAAPGNGRYEAPTSIKKDVATFYNEQTDNFLKVYGTVIQAFRTKNIRTLLDYQIKAIGLKQDVKALDAGCGVCGPAVYFAQQTNCHIEALTISGVQVEKAKLTISEAKLEGKVHVREGDYHTLEKYYPANHFDVIYFLESFGHALNHERVLDSAWKVLKPGGLIYIKDLFIKKALHKAMEQGIEKEIGNINAAYHYNVPELNTILDYVRKKGYILSSLKTIDIPLEEFENLTISNDFQELTGINKIDHLRDYVFPVDFFELKLMKPSMDVNSGNSRYFLQNLYFMQIEHWKETDL